MELVWDESILKTFNDVYSWETVPYLLFPYTNHRLVLVLPIPLSLWVIILLPHLGQFVLYLGAYLFVCLSSYLIIFISTSTFRLLKECKKQPASFRLLAFFCVLKSRTFYSIYKFHLCFRQSFLKGIIKRHASENQQSPHQLSLTNTCYKWKEKFSDVLPHILMHELLRDSILLQAPTFLRWRWSKHDKNSYYICYWRF